MVWALDKRGIFSVKSATFELDKAAYPPNPVLIKSVWSGLIPHRIEVFTWLALIGKINSKEKLAHLGIIPPSEALCVFCKSHTKSICHLFLHCDFSRKIWVWWLSLWDLNWVFPLHLNDAFLQWKYKNCGPFFKKVWCAIFFIIIWSIWKERNSRIFCSKSSSPKRGL